jgi:hypothetical protein
MFSLSGLNIKCPSNDDCGKAKHQEIAEIGPE